MYEQFYNLESNPFETTPDPSFLWLGEKHKEALAALRYGIIENKGFLLLTGESGTGKTTLVNALGQSLEDNVEWAVISNPAMERIDFYNAIAAGFMLEKNFTSKVQFLIQFSHFLHKAHDEGKKVVLIVDNCHRLSQEMLEELRLLSNIEKVDTKLINIFFIGQNEFNDILALPKNRAVRQRLMLKVELLPLNVNEVEEYIKYRLGVAGVQEKLFAAKTVQTIHRISKGVPRHINVLCAHALVGGAIRSKKSIDHRLLEECLAKLGLPANPSMDDLMALSAERRNLDIFREKFIANGGVVLNGAVDYSFEEEKSKGWFKYAIGTFALVVFCIYLWWPQEQTVKVVEVDSSATQQGKEISPAGKGVGESPAVTMLGKQSDRINDKKAGELKSAILEKAYNSEDEGKAGGKSTENHPENGEPQKGKSLSVTVAAKSGQVAPVVQSAAPKEAVTSSAPGETQKQAPGSGSLAGAHAEKMSGAVQAAGQKNETASVETQQEGQAQATAKPLPPFEPKKLVLPLQANAQKLTAQAEGEVERLVKKLKDYPQVTLLVKGFVSSDKDSPENTSLSQSRADNVRNLLLAKGVAADRVKAKGMGVQEPIASNAAPAGREKNRRVEIVIVEKGQ